MADEPLAPGLWAPRTVEDTLRTYADWAATYEADVEAAGYVTPARIAEALWAVLPDPAAEILDFGCGTGFSGLALRARGYTAIDGTDISAEMLDEARPRGIYRRAWVGKPGEIEAAGYAAVVAAGVISMGAAPPETLDQVLDAMDDGAYLALSFNDPTLADGRHDARLAQALADGRAGLLFRAHGPHLTGKDMGSDVIVLQKLG